MNNVLEFKKYKDFQDFVLNKEGVIFVNFYQPTCGPCRMLDPILEQLVEENSCATLVKIDVSDQKQLTFDFSVEAGVYINATPTTLIYKDGALIDTVVGYQPLEEWKKYI